MILVDSSVWIDYFNGRQSDQTDLLDDLLGEEELVIGDLILTEVLQGFRHDRAFREARRLLESLEYVNLLGYQIAIRAAENYRFLRSIGVTVRKTIDTLIATSCMEKGMMLLYSDRDFDPFVLFLGLRSVDSFPET